MKGLVLDASWEPRKDYPLSTWEKKTRKAITGSSVWRNPTLTIVKRAVPTLKPGQVLIEVRACGVCGSDMHFYETDNDGYILYPGLTRFPVILGHELSGRIVQVADGVSGLKKGDPVTVEEMIWCGFCVPCRNGFPNHCTNLEEIGFTIDGGFADYIAIDAKYCWRVDGILERFGEEKGYEVAALTEPTCVAYNGIFVRAGGFRPGARVSVFGAGPIGLASIGLAHASGASTIVAFEVSSRNLALAKKVGADHVFDPRKVSPHEVLKELSSGDGFDVHVEAAGAPHLTIPEMEKALAINGSIVQIGRAAQRVPMYLETFQVRRSQLYGAQGHSGHGTFPNVIRLVASGRLDLSPIITARYDLDHAVDAIAQSTSRNDGKILVRPR